MGVDLRPDAAMACPDSAGGGFKVVPVDRFFGFVEIRHGVDIIPVIRAEEGRFDRTAAS